METILAEKLFAFIGMLCYNRIALWVKMPMKNLRRIYCNEL